MPASSRLVWLRYDAGRGRGRIEINFSRPDKYEGICDGILEWLGKGQGSDLVFYGPVPIASQAGDVEDAKDKT
jgi:hypothetical protein